jgi:hypothetical protein
LITFYTNRELAKNLSINLAKWKRWSREFLRPDPLGGMQSGYTRQYSIDDAFTVYLGGHLVSAVKFTIPEAKRILQDLNDWLTTVGVDQNSGDHLADNTGEGKSVKNYIIFIQPRSAGFGQPVDFHYRIRGIIDNTVVQRKPELIRHERYVETVIPSQSTDWAASVSAGVRLLNLTAVLQQFAHCLKIPTTR